MGFKEQLGNQLLFFDGAMGTMLQERGLSSGELPELWNISKEEVILDIHKQYLASGCNIIKANTFGANPFKVEGTGYTCEELTAKGIAIVKRAIAESGREAYAALDIGSLGKLLEPLGDLSFEEAYEAFKPMCVAGAQAGADLCLIETMNDTYCSDNGIRRRRQIADRSGYGGGSGIARRTWGRRSGIELRVWT